MSKESTSYDVKVALYDVSKGKAALIEFYNDSEALFDCKRIKLVRDEDRLYFHRGDLVKDSIKLSGHTYNGYKNLLQLYSDYSKVEDMEGYYNLKFDSEMDLYYIDKQQVLSPYIRRGDTRKGVKQLNHNPGDREKRGDYIMTATLKEPAKKIVENKKQQEVQTKSMEQRTATTIVIKALINLLKTQVEGNEEALSTIDALEKYI